MGNETDDLKKENEALKQANADLRAENKSLKDKAGRGEESVTPWMKPDYDGPITSEIAAFRNQAFMQKDGKTVCTDDFELHPKTGIAVRKKADEKTDNK